MTVEIDLFAVLEVLCPRVFPDEAPFDTATPYVTFQGIGGESLRYVDNTAKLRHSMVQVNVWADTRLECLALARSIEEALCAAEAFTARPDSEPIWDSDGDTERRGCLQDFSIWSKR